MNDSLAALVPHFTGPLLIGGFCEAICLGVVLSQAQTFFKVSNDPVVLKVLVAFVTFVAWCV